MPIILELTVYRDADDRCAADLRLSAQEHATDLVFSHGSALALDMPRLLEASLDPARYGALLSRMVFANPQLLRGWRYARSYAEALGEPMLVGLRIVDEGAVLHQVGWELLCDPETGHRLGLSERTMMVRYCNLDRPLPVARPSRCDVGHVIAVASPRDLPDYGLAPIPAQTIVADARQEHGTLASIVLDGSYSHRRATLPRILMAMRSSPRMLYLVCHGSTAGGEVYLWLEDEAGLARPTPASELVEALSGLGAAPPLVAILACEGAGRLHSDAVPHTLGPQLMGAGVPAVLLFRDTVPLAVSHSLMPVFWRELARDGSAPRALGAARSQMGGDAWGQSVLWTRVRDGSVWA